MSGTVIAIDGPAASGTSSTARAVAEALGFAHLDSGALYRAVTLVAIGEGERRGTAPASVDPDITLRSAEDRGLLLYPDGAGFAAYLDGVPVDQPIREPAVTRHVSAVSAMPAVREWVNARLRSLVREGRNVVVDGRDIGTVVFPDAQLKVFLTATPEARAGRRISQRGQVIDVDELARETAALAARDQADSARAIAPLRRAADAVDIDTTRLTFAEQVGRIVALARERIPGG